MADEAETWRSLRSDVLDYGRAYSSKPEKGIHGKRVAPRAFGSSPRAVGHLSGSPRAAGHLSGSPRAAGHLSGSPRAAGHLSGSPRAAGHLSGSPGEFSRAGQKSHRELGDGFRKCSPSELHRSQGESWRERPSGHAARWRKDSARQEGEDLGRPLEEGTRWKQKKAHVSQEAGETVIHASGRKRRMRKRDHGEVEEDGEAPVTNVSSLSEGELVCLRAEERIGRDEIYRVKRHPGNSPKTWYSCGLCDVLLDSVAAAHKHMKEKWHKKRAKERREEVMLTEILPPGQQQVQDVGSAIQKEVEEVGLSEEDVERRHSVVSSMEEVVRSVLPDCTLRLYGSSCTRFGFKGSDVNIDIQFPSHMHQPDVLLLIQESLSSSSLYVNLEADFHARVPVVVCTEKQSGLVCKVSAGNDSAYLTTAYLSALSKLEPLLLPLVIAFRRWAQICHVDRPEEGGLPPYVVSLMVVYFLQQRKEPLLPAYLGPWIPEFSLNKLVDFRLTGVENGQVLWEYSPSPAEATPSSERFLKKGKSSLVFEPEGRGSVAVGQVWVEMLRFYSLECDMADRVISVRINSVFSRESKDWPKKRIAVEDPFSVKRNVARSLNSQLMYDYILHCLRTAYKYFALPLSQQSVPRTNRSSHLPLSDARLVQSELGKLSLSPRVANGRPGEEDGGPALQEDADCVVEEVIEDPDERRPLEDEENEDVDPTHLPHFPREEQEAVSVTSSDSDSGSTDDPPAESNKGPSFESNQSEEEEDEDEGGRGRPHLDSCTTEEEQYLPDAASGEDLLSEDEGSRVTHAVRQEDVLETPGLAATVPAEHLRYEFNKQVFTRGKSHAIVCSLCKHDGHLKRDCPEDFKRVELDPLPPMTPKFLRVLNEVCIQCYRDFAPDDIEVRVREHILQDLEKFVRHQFEGAKLRLFGSSKNGFGFKQSDLDICMVLEGQETSEGLDCIGIIDGLARVLRKHTGLRNILPITTAKVPIVKFFHVRTGLEGDISLYNTLALHNTRLLASYAAIDPRVKHLCYVMKVFAKVCDIGDASRGSLSSYAYTLMVLFFLQQRKPPVIPVLQEIYDGQKKPEILVDGWNVYFFHRLEDLSQRWPEYRTNKESLGELWLGLLQFYTQEFDFREHVVSIRRHQLLTTFKKQWTSKYIVIEDPFDLNHNLGAGLSRRMTNFIMKAFINGRRVFGTPIKVFPSEYSSKMEYFFDPEVLTEGQLAPNDRCCRICGKIGHFMKDCPMRRKVRQKRDQYEDGWRRYGDQEREWPENQEGGRNRTPRQADRRRRREEKRCFLCGSHAHIKKECPHYKGSAGSPFSPSPSTSSHMKNFRERQVSPQQLEEKKKQKQPKVILSPQAGSLANRHTTQGRSTPKGSPLD